MFFTTPKRQILGNGIFNALLRYFFKKCNLDKV